MAMSLTEFGDYLIAFEAEIIVKGIKQGIFRKKELVSPKPCKLAKSGFSVMMGAYVFTDDALCVDYYGYRKPSGGLILTFRKNGGSAILCPVVHFASIKIENISELNYDLLRTFALFKDTVLGERGFRKK